MTETVEQKIRRQAGRGMRQLEIERIYGRDIVRAILGDPNTPPLKAGPMPFCKRLAVARAAHHMTIVDLAQLIGIKPEHMQRFEDGTMLPTSHVIISKIAAFMGEGANELFDEILEQGSRK